RRGFDPFAGHHQSGFVQQRGRPALTRQTKVQILHPLPSSSIEGRSFNSRTAPFEGVYRGATPRRPSIPYRPIVQWQDARLSSGQRRDRNPLGDQKSGEQIAALAQTAEAAGLNPARSEFESQVPHQKRA